MMARDGIRNERGAALIEFALTLPLLLLLILGIFDFGFAFHRYNAVANAAREGARMAVLPGYSVTDVENRVAAYLEAAGVPGTPTTTATLELVTPDTGPAFAAWTVTVEVDYVFAFLGAMGSELGTVTMQATAMMRSEIVAGGV